MNRDTHWKLLTSTALAGCWLTVPGLLWECRGKSREEQLVDALRPGFEQMKAEKA